MMAYIVVGGVLIGLALALIATAVIVIVRLIRGEKFRDLLN